MKNFYKEDGTLDFLGIINSILAIVKFAMSLLGSM